MMSMIARPLLIAIALRACATGAVAQEKDRSQD